MQTKYLIQNIAFRQMFKSNRSTSWCCNIEEFPSCWMNSAETHMCSPAKLWVCCSGGKRFVLESCMAVCLSDRSKPGEPWCHGNGPESQCWHSTLVSVGIKCVLIPLHKVTSRVHADVDYNKQHLNCSLGIFWERIKGSTYR